MSTTKDELLAATIRKQITYLECLLVEMDQQPGDNKDIAAKIHQVETHIRELRARLHDV